MIRNGTMVTFHYTLSVDGGVVGSTYDAEPLTYIHGLGQLVPGLEEAITDMTQGERRHFDIPPEKGYGPHHPEAVQTIQRGAFRNPEALHAGAIVAGEVDGRQFQAVVRSVDDGEVTLDLNHPLAGKTLSFDIEILEVRPIV